MSFGNAPPFVSAWSPLGLLQFRWAGLLVAGMLVVLCAGQARAQVNNGDFSAPLGPANGNAAPGNWARYGDVNRVANLGPVTPKSGNANMTYITTDKSQGAIDGAYDFDGQTGNNSYKNFKGAGANRWGWLGFSDGANLLWYLFRNGSDPASCASAIRYSNAAVNKGDVMRFRYNFLTDETIVSPGKSYEGDNACLVISDYWPYVSSSGAWEYKRVTLGSTKSSLVSGAGTGYAKMTGWKSGSFLFEEDGPFTICFLVVDYARPNKVSALLVDDIVINKPGITIDPPEPMSLVEGDFDDITIRLQSQPLPGVTVKVTLNPNPEFSSYSPAFVTFDDTNWNQKKVVTITSQQNAIAEGNRTTTINFTVTSKVGDPYDNLTDTYDVDIIDDDTPGLFPKYSANPIIVQEGTSTATYKLRLTSRPAGGNTVTVNLVPDNQIYLSAIKLIFTDQTGLPGGWDKYQTVTVTPFDDNVPEGFHTGQIKHTTSSLDPTYDYNATLNPALTLLVDVGILDNPKINDGEGSYAGTNGPPGNGGGGGGEGTFGFGAERGALAKKRAPILASPVANARGEFTVTNVSQRQNAKVNPPAPAGPSTQLGSALVAALGLGVLGVLAKLFLKKT